MTLTIFENDLLIDALTARAARYESMSIDDSISLRAEHRYQLRADAMRNLRDKLKGMKAENKPMSLAV
jgi:hypothetical protein